MQITVDTPDEFLPKIKQTGFSLQEIVAKAVQQYLNSESTLLQTQTWQLCGKLQISQPKETNIVDVSTIETNYAEQIDDILYGNLSC
jgi:hypothetical protein